MKLLQAFVIAIAMYSKIPMPKMDWKEEDMGYVFCFFPVIGIFIGVLSVCVGTFLFRKEVPTFFLAVLMTLLPLVVTGGIHLDGYMDTQDALASYGDRKKKLEILKDPNTGAFAVIRVCCYFLWNMAVWLLLKEEMAIVLTGSIYVISRAMSGFSVVGFPSAKAEGTVSMFQKAANRIVVKVVMIGYFIGSFAMLFVMEWEVALVVFLISVLFFGYYYKMSKKQFGGITGDLAGYFLQMAELLMLTGVLVGKYLF